MALNGMGTLDSGLVRRWHTTPQMSFTGQNNASHSWGVAVLAETLAPELVTKEVLWWCIVHDCGERRTADMASHAKTRMPELADILREAEKSELYDLGILAPEMSDEQKRLVKLCDILESIIFILNFAVYPNEVEGWWSAIDKASTLVSGIRVDGIWEWIDINVNSLIIKRKITDEHGQFLQIAPF